MAVDTVLNAILLGTDALITLARAMNEVSDIVDKARRGEPPTDDGLRLLREVSAGKVRTFKDLTGPADVPPDPAHPPG